MSSSTAVVVRLWAAELERRKLGINGCGDVGISIALVLSGAFSRGASSLVSSRGDSSGSCARRCLRGPAALSSGYSITLFALSREGIAGV